MRKSFGILLGLFLFAGVASAQVPSGNVFLGYSFYSTDLSSIDRANTNGWEASLEGKVFPLLGIVADFDGHYGSQNFPGVCVGAGGSVPCAFNANITENNYFFGPRLSINISKLRPFAEFEIGASHVNVKGITSDTSFGTAIGGGVDYKLFTVLAWRLQGDYIHTSFFSAAQNNVRISTGLVLRF